MDNTRHFFCRYRLFIGGDCWIGAYIKVQRHPVAFPYKRDGSGDLGGSCQWNECVVHSLGIPGTGHAGCGYDHLLHWRITDQCGCCFDNRYTASGRLTMAVSRRSPVSDTRHLYGDNLSAGDITRKPLNSTTHFFARSC